MATMNFNTANSTFRQLLANGLSYRVPPFQRDYSWTEDEWDDLWQDIQALFEVDGEPAHYMGYLVLQSSDSKRFDIIDGQQRLTTISAMVLAGLSHLQGSNRSRYGRGEQRQTEGTASKQLHRLPRPREPDPALQAGPDRHNNRFYQNYLAPLRHLPKELVEHQLRKVFYWFKERIKRVAARPLPAAESWPRFSTSWSTSFFTVITVTDELNAFKVFETLNARSVRLATDLLKNHLFSIIGAQEAHETERNVGRSLGAHCRLTGERELSGVFADILEQSQQTGRKSELFKTIRKKVVTRAATFELLRDLDRSAAVYAALRDPQDAVWNDEQFALEQLLMFNVRQPLAMLMACHAAFYERERNFFTRIMRGVAVVSFRYNVICSLQTHEQERLYNEIAWKVSNSAYANPSDVLAALCDVYPDDARFTAAFAEKELRTHQQPQ